MGHLKKCNPKLSTTPLQKGIVPKLRLALNVALGGRSSRITVTTGKGDAPRCRARPRCFLLSPATAPTLAKFDYLPGPRFNSAQMDKYVRKFCRAVLIQFELKQFLVDLAQPCRNYARNRPFAWMLLMLLLISSLIGWR